MLAPISGRAQFAQMKNGGDQGASREIKWIARLLESYLQVALARPPTSKDHAGQGAAFRRNPHPTGKSLPIIRIESQAPKKKYFP
ncbi:MAG: hypothetical protein Q7J60_19130 [Bradyrhizobium sp.]|nr:hypothetical protein [Bradyrhizobium sp.]